MLYIYLQNLLLRIPSKFIIFSRFQTPGSARDIDREKYKDFTFDHSYWSYDDADENYASQEEVNIDCLLFFVYFHYGVLLVTSSMRLKIISY